jgi:Ca2+-binding RTX toxin-like protein
MSAASGRAVRQLLCVIGLLVCIASAAVVSTAMAQDGSSAAEGQEAPPMPGPAEETAAESPAPTAAQTKELLESGDARPLPMKSETDLEAAQTMPHQELDRDAALELVEAVFEPELGAIDGIYGELEPEKFLSEYAAVVPASSLPESPGAQGGGSATKVAGGPVLVESTLPLGTKDSSGQLEAVDLGLETADGELQPSNSLAELGIPPELGEGISLPRAEVSIAVGDAPSGVAPTNVDGEFAFYPEVAKDTDLIVSPTPQGVELMTDVRSAEAPTQTTYDLSIPPAAELRPAINGGAEVVEDGQTTVAVTAPTAIDAAGNPVQTEMQVSGSGLTVSITPTLTTAYPVLVDPIWNERWYWTYGNDSLASWIPSTTNSQAMNPVPYARWTYPTIYPGLDLTSGYGGNAAAPTQANWAYWVPRYESDVARYGAAPTTWVGDMLTEGLAFLEYGNNANYPALVVGLVKPGVGWAAADWVHYGGQGEINDGSYWLWLKNGESVNGVNAGDHEIKGADMNIVTYENEYPAKLRDTYIGNDWISIWDEDAPRVISLTPPTGWTNGPSATIGYGFEDTGLGIRSAGVRRPGESTFQTGGGVDFACTGTTVSTCPRKPISTEAGLPQMHFVPNALPTGIDTLEVMAGDPFWTAGHVAAANVSVKVDNTVPAISLSGSPTPTTYKLTVATSDGSASAPQSGVKEVKVYLDGATTPVTTETNPCTATGCTYTLNFTYSQPLTGLAVGQHALKVVATDQLGQAETATQKFTVEPPDTVIDSGPSGLIKEATPKFTYHSTQEGSTFQCSVDGGPFVSCPVAGYTTAKLADGAHTFSVRAINGVGLVDQTPATRSFTVDTTPPQTTIDYGPEGATANPRPTFGYSADDPAADFQCHIDSAPFEGCGFQSEQVEPALSDGSHTFAVRAVDRAGNIDPTPATRTFTVDTTSPEVTILAGPSGPTTNAKPHFTFEASGQSGLQCALDPAGSAAPEPGWRACSGATFDEPATALADGPYVFRVRAFDATGNEAEDLRTFTVDRQAPDTTITSGPSGTTDDPKPSFGFASSQPDSTFACRFDAEAFRACSGPGATDTRKTSLADGSHSFEVRATDPAGNLDASPAKRSFTVYTAAPETKILTGPEGPTANATPLFTYSADETAAFECRVDSAAFAACPLAGKELAAQAEGEHVFEVRAKNGSCVDPTPARRVFIVDTSNPDAPALSGEVFVEPGPYGLQLNIQARDGNRGAPNTTRSGVESATLLIDGQQATVLRNRCGPMGCPDTMQREYQVSPYKAAGAHEYKFLLRDALGHERTVQWGRTMPQATLLKSHVSPEASCEHVVDVNAKHYVGKSCDEKLRVGAGVKSVNAMGGDDTILGGPGEEELRGGEGNDLIRGARSNDVILGGGGSDSLYGGVGDDTIKGGAATDVLDGGPGADEELGQGGNDTLRGGQGKDTMLGGPETDTVSFADAVAPGFKLGGDAQIGEVSGQAEGTTGVYVYVNSNKAGWWLADNGSVEEERGGKDDFSEMENIVGSAFDDVIKRPDSTMHVFAGPGADIVRGGGKANAAGGSGDNSVEGEGDNSISHPTPVEFGVQNPIAGEAETDLFLSGSSNPEKVVVKLIDGAAQFTFSEAPTADHQGCTGGPLTFNCSLSGGLGAIVLAGYAGEDELSIKGRNEFSKGSVTLAGGPNRDTLNGGAAEDVLIDGSGQGASSKPELLVGMSGDDVLLQGEGEDRLEGDAGNDLLVSSQVCGDALIGGPGGDNAQFHPYTSGPGVWADLTAGELGEHADGKHHCSNLASVEDLEGSPEADVFHGTKGHNLLLGRGGRDVLVGEGGGDNINAKDRLLDALINCSNDLHTKVHVDAGTEITAAERRQGLKGIFKNCKAQQIVTTGPTYDDKNGQVNAAKLLAVQAPPVPARLARLQRGEASEPPESAAPNPEVESPLASYVAMDDIEGVVATNFFDEESDGTYEAAGQGPSVNGPGPQLGTASALQEGEGTSVTLDGADDLIALPNQMGLEGAKAQGGFSVEMLVRFSRAPGGKEYLYSSGAGANGLFLYRAANGVITLAAGNDTGAPEVSSYTAISDNAWHQVVGVVEEHALTLYVDGLRSKIGFGETAVMPEPFETATTTIGVGPGQTGFLQATVDEFATYEGGLSETIVQSHLEETAVTEPAEILVPAPETIDTDADGVTDGVDNCPSVANANQADANHDGIGDACLMPDIDGDGVEDGSDNCPEAVNADQADANADGVGDACAQLPPEVTTGAATGVTSEGATLNGTVTPGGTATTYKFEYGTTIAYGKSIPVPAASLPSGAAVVPVSRSIASLAPQTTYHYRVVAENTFGKTEGQDQTFTTPSSAIGEQLAKMAVTEPFDGSAASLSNFSSSWTLISWTSNRGEDSKTGWRATDAWPTPNGVFYYKAVPAPNNGIAAVATLTSGPTISERSFSLWLGMPAPTATPRSGYELRFTETATANAYEVSLASWSSGTKTVLAQKSPYTLSAGSQFAIVAKGGSLSAWIGSGGVFTELLSGKSTTYTSGYSGLEAVGNITRISNFKTGSLS